MSNEIQCVQLFSDEFKCQTIIVTMFRLNTVFQKTFTFGILSMLWVHISDLVCTNDMLHRLCCTDAMLTQQICAGGATPFSPHLAFITIIVPNTSSTPNSYKLRKSCRPRQNNLLVYFPETSWQNVKTFLTSSFCCNFVIET